MGCFLAALPHYDLCAQRHTQNGLFKAGATFGVNLSQTDGDSQVGYDYHSIMGGLRGAIVLHPSFEIATELLYTRRGARPKKGLGFANESHIYLETDYAEVPLLLRGYFPRTETRFFGFELYAGASYGRMVRSEVRPLIGNIRSDTANLVRIQRNGLRSSDVSLIMGAGLYVTRRGGLFIRHTVSLTPYYRDPNPPPVRTGFAPTDIRRFYSFFRNYYWTLGAFYDVVSPKPAKKKSAPRARPMPRS